MNDSQKKIIEHTAIWRRVFVDVLVDMQYCVKWHVDGKISDVVDFDTRKKIQKSTENFLQHEIKKQIGIQIKHIGHVDFDM
jgi:hypothetical protein